MDRPCASRRNGFGSTITSGFARTTCQPDVRYGWPPQRNKIVVVYTRASSNAGGALDVFLAIRTNRVQRLPALRR